MAAYIIMTSFPTPTNSIDSVEINGKTYYASSTTSALSATSGDFIGMAIAVDVPLNITLVYKHHFFEAFAMIEPPYAFVNWSTHS
jgi:hypothetical protein